MRASHWVWVGALLAVGCNTGRDAPDGFWWPDAGFSIDAAPPSAPVCDGAATACEEREAGECSTGCRLEQCAGEPSRCDSYFLERFCVEARGCSWSGDECFGFAEACGGQADATSCTNQGCEWHASATCVGSPTPCSSLSETECPITPGCSSLLDAGAPDAGRDAGRDAGARPADAAALCRPPGTCDPFASRPCSGTELCVFGGDGMECIPRTRTLASLGEVCDPTRECEPGLSCIGGPSEWRCRALCREGSTSDCSAGSICGQVVSPTVECLHLCQRPCDLYAQDCPAGDGCYAYPSLGGGACYDEGDNAIGTPCTYLSDCVPGGACIRSVCRQLCRSTEDCVSGTCTLTSTSGVNFCNP